MLKKNAKIIMGACNASRENLCKVYFDPDTGFYYACDGFRMLRIEPTEIDRKELSVFEDMRGAPNFKRYMECAADATYTDVEIPYYAKQIDDWRKSCNKRGKKMPFTLGVKGRNSRRTTWWIGINPKFLVDAMTTTGSNTISVPDKGNMLLMQGNGYLWLIMPVECKDEYEWNHSMTEIPAEVIT